MNTIAETKAIANGRIKKVLFPLKISVKITRNIRSLYYTTITISEHGQDFKVTCSHDSKIITLFH